jgi:hypothetical protein
MVFIREFPLVELSVERGVKTTGGGRITGEMRGLINKAPERLMR